MLENFELSDQYEICFGLEVINNYSLEEEATKDSI